MSYFEFPHTRTYDSDLGWIIKTIKNLCTIVDSLGDWKIEHEKEYEQLKKLYDDIMAGNFPESITNAFDKWMKTNAIDIVGEMAKMVYFGIDDNGHWVAYIPESWEDITFRTTGYDINIPDTEYGQLVLMFTIGGN